MSTKNQPLDFIGGLHRGEMAADHFTIVANLVARDRKLSCRAKGLFLNMASHKAGLRITEEFLASQCTDGVKAIRSILLELRDAGYVYRSQERTRYPRGTVNAKGKDISGALGPYQWFVTDKPAEVAVILARYAQEQRELLAVGAEAVRDAAGQDLRHRGAVPTSDDRTEDASAPQPSLPPRRAASLDLRKQGKTAVRDLLPKPPVGSGSSIEDDPQKTISKEEETGGRRAAPQTPAQRTSAHPDQLDAHPDQLDPVGNSPPARAEQEPGARARQNREDTEQRSERGEQDASGYGAWSVEQLLAELERQHQAIQTLTGQASWTSYKACRTVEQELRTRGHERLYNSLGQLLHLAGEADPQELTLSPIGTVTTKTGKTRMARTRRR